MVDRVVTAAVVIIGNEILSGRTTDANLPFLARQLDAIGIRLKEVRVVADEAQAIADAVNQLRVRFDHVLTTGGIGPTHDDITSARSPAPWACPSPAIPRPSGACAPTIRRRS